MRRHRCRSTSTSRASATTSSGSPPRYRSCCSRSSPSSRDYSFARGKASMRRGLGPVLVGTLLAAGALLTAFPFFWMLTTSLKPIAESYTYPPTVLPSTITLDSYLRLFRDFDFGRYLVNTISLVLLAFLGIFFLAMPRFRFSE